MEKIGILADYVYLVPMEAERRGTLNRFLFVVRPQTLGVDEMGSWEGTASLIKAALESSVSHATKVITNKIGNL